MPDLKGASSRMTECIVGQLTTGSSSCVGALVAADGVPNNSWIVGDTVMKNTYTVFDELNNVGPI